MKYLTPILIFFFTLEINAQQIESMCKLDIKTLKETKADSLWDKPRVRDTTKSFLENWDANKAMTFNPGDYNISFYSEVGIYFDTNVTLLKGEQTIIVDLRNKIVLADMEEYLIDELNKNETYQIWWEDSYCCGGICCKWVDNIIIQNTGDRLQIKYLDDVSSINCLDSPDFLSPDYPYKVKKVTKKKLNLIKSFEKKNTSNEVDNNYVNDCYIRLGNKIIICEGIDYLKFKKKLINN